MPEPINDMAELFKALGDPTRLNIIRLLLSHDGKLCVGMLAHKLGISQPAVSQQLKVLKNAGLVEADRMGFHMHYTVMPGALKGFGVNAGEFFKALGAENPEKADCELAGDTQACDAIN
jgi:ArsR family transcriptional regulator